MRYVGNLPIAWKPGNYNPLLPSMLFNRQPMALVQPEGYSNFLWLTVGYIWPIVDLDYGCRHDQELTLFFSPAWFFLVFFLNVCGISLFLSYSLVWFAELVILIITLDLLALCACLFLRIKVAAVVCGANVDGFCKLCANLTYFLCRKDQSFW